MPSRCATPMRGHGLAGAARPVEQRGDAAAVRQLLAELPAVEHLGREADVVDDLVELLLPVGRQHDVVEREDRLDALGEVRDAFGRDLLAGRDETAPRGIGAAEGQRPLRASRIACSKPSTCSGNWLAMAAAVSSDR